MSRQIINNTPSGSGLGDTLYVATTKINAMTEELYASGSLLASEVDNIIGILDTLNDGSLLDHTHTISQIVNLQTVLNSKVNTSIFNAQNAATAASISTINTTLSDIVDILNTKVSEAPVDGIQYARKDGSWVPVSGSGGGDLSGYVPYTGSTQDVDLGAHSLTANDGLLSSWNGGQFSANPLANPPFFVFSDNREFDSDVRTVTIGSSVENGVGIGYTNLTSGKESNISVKNEIILTSTDNSGPASIIGSLTVEPTRVYSNKKVVSNEGFEGNYVQFNTSSTEPNAVGKLNWNDTDGTLNLGLKGGNVTLQIGQEQVTRVVNKTGGNLTEAGYEAVYVSGAQGQRLKVDLALANSDLTSAGTLGVVTENIAVNQEGFITTTGLVRGINTTGALQGETWNDGDMLYLSPTVAGRITNIKPSAPQHSVTIGYVVYAHANQGTIYVKVDNGYEIDELHNVKVTTPATNDILGYSGSLWVNKPVSGWLGYTPQPALSYTPFKWLATNSTPHTGSISEVIVGTATIIGGTFNSSDVMKVFMQTSKPLTTGSVSYRYRINTSNTLSGATTVGSFTTTNTLSYVPIQRTFTLRDNLLYGNFSNAVNDLANTAGSLSSTTYNTANTLYVFFTAQLGNIADSATISLMTVTN
jgi:hypothetical protein